MTNYDFFKDTDHQNLLFDLLFDQKCKDIEAEPKPHEGHYKASVGNQVHNILTTYYDCLHIQDALNIDPIEKISFEFSEEYGDSGRTYLCASISVSYKTKDEDGDECEVEALIEESFFEDDNNYYDDDEYSEENKELLEMLNDNDKNILNEILQKMNELDPGDETFYEQAFDKNNTPLGAFARDFPNEKAMIDKFLIGKNIQDTVNKKSRVLKNPKM